MVSMEPIKPLAAWKGKDRYEGSVLDSLTVIFKSGGCSYRRCLMCGYRFEGYFGASPEEILAQMRGQLAWVEEHFDLASVQMVKIFTSGSFLDPVEVPPAFREDVCRAFAGKVVVVETRPEYVEEEGTAAMVAALDTGAYETPLHIAVGLETTDDAIREKSIRKGFTFADFIAASRRAQAAGAGVKGYLLLKPMFLTEKEAVEDMKKSIREVTPYCGMISMNACTVQRGTELEKAWKERTYRPPYLWSILEVLADISGDVPVFCDPVGGGATRGPHNCGTCDRELVQGINDFALTGDVELVRALLDEVECGCKKEWEYVMEHERPWCMPLTR
ncbi:TIGR01210 family radical SAM protein [Methanofollis formosanus]|uniref:TIGR01210 family radical SAM protein n=2 Tax=Methanofollis formosanus TaxID=299308 RepID=A0A8G1A0V2_9EURY|nr:archaeosine biosynthesis radical SAM protein RaSEA [Methanofollis formosanus]QYZ78378.1 TIGR01210 family radical SAM protein [Methanofollis formosanus]